MRTQTYTAEQDHDQVVPAMNGSPKVSVLTTAYNPGPYLERAMESVWSQTFSNFEVILVDNGCTDGSIDAVACEDERFRLSRCSHNIGRTPALIQGFELARGEYIAVLDADDIWHESHLEKLVECLNNNPHVVLAGTWCRWIDADGREINRTQYPTDRSQIRDRLAWRNPFIHSSVIYRRNVAVEAGGYDPDFVFAQDFDLWLRLFDVGETAMLPHFLTDVRVHNQNATHNPDYALSRAYDELRLYRRVAKYVPISMQARLTNRKVVADMGLKYSHLLSELRRYSESWKWWLWSHLQDPLVTVRRRIRQIRSRD